MALSEKRKLAVGHLTDALEADEPSEKDFHVRAALQLLTVEAE